MELKKIKGKFSVCKVANYWMLDEEEKYCFVGKTDEECSLVCRTEKVPENTIERSDGWRMFRIEGELDLSLIGILEGIARLLSEHQIPFLVESTYNTDYILTKEEDYETAIHILDESGYSVV